MMIINILLSILLIFHYLSPLSNAEWIDADVQNVIGETFEPLTSKYRELSPKKRFATGLAVGCK